MTDKNEKFQLKSWGIFLTFLFLAYGVSNSAARKALLAMARWLWRKAGVLADDVAALLEWAWQATAEAAENTRDRVIEVSQDTMNYLRPRVQRYLRRSRRRLLLSLFIPLIFLIVGIILHQRPIIAMGGIILTVAQMFLMVYSIPLVSAISVFLIIAGHPINTPLKLVSGKGNEVFGETKKIAEFFFRIFKIILFWETLVVLYATIIPLWNNYKMLPLIIFSALVIAVAAMAAEEKMRLWFPKAVKFSAIMVFIICTLICIFPVPMQKGGTRLYNFCAGLLSGDNIKFSPAAEAKIPISAPQVDNAIQVSRTKVNRFTLAPGEVLSFTVQTGWQYKFETWGKCSIKFRPDCFPEGTKIEHVMELNKHNFDMPSAIKLPVEFKVIAIDGGDFTIFQTPPSISDQS